MCTYTHTCAHIHICTVQDGVHPVQHPFILTSLQSCISVILSYTIRSWNRNASTPCIFFISFHCWFCIDYLLFVKCFLWNDLSGGTEYSSEPAFCLNIPDFSCLILYYRTGWAQLSWIPLGLRSPLCLVACKLGAALGCSVCVGRVSCFPLPSLRGFL